MITIYHPSYCCYFVFFEPVFSLFSPLEFNGRALYTCSSSLLLFILIFIAVYYSRQLAIVYGIVFGLLYDMFYIDIIGLYAFLYPLICFIATYALFAIVIDI